MSIWQKKISLKIFSFIFLRAPLYKVHRHMRFWNGSAWRTRSRACVFFNKETEESNPTSADQLKTVMMSY